MRDFDLNVSTSTQGWLEMKIGIFSQMRGNKLGGKRFMSDIDKVVKYKKKSSPQQTKETLQAHPSLPLEKIQSEVGQSFSECYCSKPFDQAREQNTKKRGVLILLGNCKAARVKK